MQESGHHQFLAEGFETRGDGPDVFDVRDADQVDLIGVRAGHECVDLRERRHLRLTFRS
ncbi:hypothetical protein BN2537_3255 [Streptomyces venezuelae]|nr:hypothetical protein BN2537_3255 [Streptomyces venezuelae]